MSSQGTWQNSFLSALLGGVVVFIALLVILPRVPQITAPIIIGALKDNPQTLAQILTLARNAQQQLDEQQLLAGASVRPEMLLDKSHAYVRTGSQFSEAQPLYIVEFGDYLCPVCKTAHRDLETLLSEQQDIQFIYHHLPLLDVVSEQAAIRVMAAESGEERLHDYLFQLPGRLSEETLREIAAELALDSPDVETAARLAKVLESNKQLAQQLGVLGTPAFVLLTKSSSGDWIVDAMAGWPATSVVEQRLSKLRSQI